MSDGSSGTRKRIRLVDVRAGGLVWHAVEWEVGALCSWLARHFPIRPDSDVRFLQAAPNRFVAAAEGFVIKEAGPRPGRARLGFGLRRPAGRLILRRAWALLERGIPTHEPVAWAVRREWGLRVRDYVITREIPDGEVLTRRLDRDGADPAARAETVRVWGALVAALHRKGISNRDLKDANMICSRRRPLRMWMTDLEGVRAWPFLPRSVAAGDLKPVALSLRCHGWLRDSGDAAAFFGAYNAGVPARLRRTAFP